jgi:hypothetical protein
MGAAAWATIVGGDTICPASPFLGGGLLQEPATPSRGRRWSAWDRDAEERKDRKMDINQPTVVIHMPSTSHMQGIWTGCLRLSTDARSVDNGRTIRRSKTFAALVGASGFALTMACVYVENGYPSSYGNG